MLTKTTFGKLIEGEQFHFSHLHDESEPDTATTYVKASARKFARKGLTRTNPIDTAKRTVWSTGRHA